MSDHETTAETTDRPSRPVLTELEPGRELFSRTFAVDRDLLVRYAGASGDFNPIHYNDRFAREVGLPGVIAHGMATMGLAATAVVDWAGDPGAVVDYGVRFTRPVEVPDPGHAEVSVVGTVAAVDLASSTVRLSLAVTCAGVSVLAKAQAVVRLG
ncbi:MaoC/PaaZ C-terminal domain-containing protein [Georgenia sp. AZ-5]|uniref:MaoC/PaaZ C-terminal domain-containing protein n=1 Tax=Georgenia sp. AZ-5 TaxID=3367526 RepID=UPI0037541A3A